MNVDEAIELVSLSRLSGGQRYTPTIPTVENSLSRLSGGQRRGYKSHQAINSLSRLSGGVCQDSCSISLRSLFQLLRRLVWIKGHGFGTLPVARLSTPA